jgi:uncharacterized protein YbgA (DUF1722 family)/uncharacterized protein YbbK (DUF523 family)
VNKGQAISELPKIGISRCLLGERVRYDGSQKQDRYLTDVLGRYVEWVGVCPEVECGLPVPREAMRLVGEPGALRLITQRTRIDLTAQMTRWIEPRLDRLSGAQICGFVFKARSPSSAMRDANIYSESGTVIGKSPGLFAAAFMKRFPLIPVEDEGRLNDPGIRENFIERLFVFDRFQSLVRKGVTRDGLVDFHTDHKLLILSHSPEALRELGRMTASIDFDRTPDRYLILLMEALKKKATVNKHVNVLQHMLGYFKKVLSADEKQEALEIVGRYHRGLVPLIVPVTLLNHYARKVNESYLKRQHYLNPHPAELMLRNHV